MNVSHFLKPDESVKSVLVYFTGTYPPKSGFYVAKDVNLPTRLYPNAKFAIRCDTGERNFTQNKKFFGELYKGFPHRLVTDKQMYENLKVDVIWWIHWQMNFFGGIMDKYTFAKNFVLQETNAKVHIIYNEENIKLFEPLWDYIQRRNEKFQKDNEQFVKQLHCKEDWSNVTLICNQDRFKEWANDRIAERILPTVNVSYLSDKILYDLPDADTLTCSIKPDQTTIKGMYVGVFNPTRVSFWKKHMQAEVLNLFVAGYGAEKINSYNPFDSDGKAILNTTVKQWMRSGDYSYSIYFGKGTESLYLGATFYEPILNGIALFIWEGTDPQHKLYSDLDCYFKDDVDLQSLINRKYSNTNELIKLWKEQIKIVER